MNDEPEPIASPCVRNCCLDENDVCLGCFRTIEEITQWTSLSIEEQKIVIANCDARKIALKNRN